MVQDENEIGDILNRIDPNLERKRKGAWQALRSSSLDGFSQAISSMRELFNQLLHELAPDDAITKATWYRQPSKGNAKVTRQMRVHFALSGDLEVAEQDLKLIESFAELVDIIYSKLSAGVHKRGIGIELQVNAYLKLCETAILNLFVHRKEVNGWSIELRCDVAPFNDIRVRRAMQMAINRRTMAQVLDRGWATGKPAGLISPKYIGFFTPYEKWPGDLQVEYGYNPSEAKRLLAEAGYPNGFITCIIVPARDIDAVALIREYFTAIGLEMQIDVKETAVWAMLAATGRIEQMIGLTLATAIDKEPDVALSRRSSKNGQNYTRNNDAKYEELISKIATATTADELKRLCVEADIYALRQHWAIQLYI